MRTGLAALLIAGSALAGCTAPAVQAPGPVVQPPPTRPYSPAGLESVLGQTFRSMVAQFGQPDLDLTEGSARKLQFLGAACVLDAYLYPPRGGRGEAVVTHIDARMPDGREMDRSSCVAALSQRPGAR